MTLAQVKAARRRLKQDKRYRKQARQTPIDKLPKGKKGK